ncbi:SDR family oxidoreductase [Williamwhitmania taraxaci]|uniref:Short-chain dehydrogenase n=1 Tax=Williamwhitmania taraxaci TaxID=1640674 RepID=A0A1G6H835_9BACT|nr:SDR family oxidoreductase [Williamwhitmania taraxaci]SDB90447.1 Short-chain dehydrogenase [Williamwhitmania taraxaci]
MQKTILITGASTGIGKETAIYFAKKGWNVAATMRSPEKENEINTLQNVQLFRLDVMDETSISEAINETIGAFGGIDVVFNNAGYALVGAFEAMSNENIKRQFETNVFGVMNVTRAILPYFRDRKGGTIINTTSMGGLLTFPLYSVYHATKWALEGFMESLQFELRQFNIKVKNIEPGAIKTDFYDRSLDFASKPGLNAYDSYVDVAHNNMLKIGKTATGPLVVAKKVFKAANDSSYMLRYPVGGNGPLLLAIRWILPLSWFNTIVKRQVEKGFKTR